MSSPTNHVEQEESAVAKQSLWQAIWQNNKGAVLILMAEVVGTSMDAIVRSLQQGERGMHPFQLMFARMLVIAFLSMIYLWWYSVPDFLLGQKGVRGWLVLRSACGFFGLLCFYYSVHYLPLAEATIFRFLVPIPTAYVSYLILGSAFTKKELAAGIVALVGVVIIAHPASIFGEVYDGIHANRAGEVDEVSPAQRALAITVACLGTFGTVGAYTMIRVIGNRAHALISVNYFAVLGCIASGTLLLVIPGIGFIMPSGPHEWILLFLLGILGFILQFLLTAGLQLDKSSKATSMMYTQIIFALICDWAIWRVIPGVWSFVGGGVVIASTLWAALQKPDVKMDRREEGVADEETALLGAQVHDAEELPGK